MDDAAVLSLCIYNVRYVSAAGLNVDRALMNKGGGGGVPLFWSINISFYRSLS
jgi:hypothetical protein